MKNIISYLYQSRNIFSIALIIAMAGACAPPSKSRMGMVIDEKTGIMYGSAIENSLVTDASFYKNRKIKIRTRNTSGDTAFNLASFTGNLDTAYAEKGYTPTSEEDFGLIMDVNVLYSGQIQRNLANEFGLIGALVGSKYGGQTDRGITLATISGAAIGNILGHYATEDTYIIVAQVTFAVVKPYKKSKKRVTFSRSEKLVDIDDPNEEEKIITRGLKKRYMTQITVYAGGRNLSQSTISDKVKARAVRIVADFI